MKNRASIGVLVTLGAAAVSWSACAAGAYQDSAQPGGGGAVLAVPMHDGVRAVRVADPHAPTTAATAEDAGDALLALHARVIVRAADAAPLALALGARPGGPLKARPADPTGAALREFWIVDCAGVAEACALAAALRDVPGIAEAYLDATRPLVTRSTLPSDPGFAQQWSLHNTANPLFDADLAPAWKAGYTGAGVTVGVVEFGWNIAHPDLADKYHADASQPAAGSQDHGTSVAGIIGMIADNGIGGAGAAYGAMLARMYIGSDTATAGALAFRNDLNFVKNNSWGPSDNARVSTMPSITAQAIADGATTGRGGLGTVYVWAGGNGGQANDRVDYDPYASNRYVIAVGAIDSIDRRSLYSEPGSALMLVTQSDYDLNTSGDVGIYTTSGASGYTATFGGSSAAAPLASGAVAVLLQARPDLTARDVQHVLIRSARRCRPADASWTTNGAGRWVSEVFGFGAIDVGAAVTEALAWPGIGPEVSHETDPVSVNAAIPDNNPAGLTSTVVVGPNIRVERVQLVLNAPHSSLGQLRVSIVSPLGTESLFANTRTDTTSGYNNYVFTSVRHWDEAAAGTWTLRIADTVAGTTGTLQSWRLRIYGSTFDCPCDWDTNGTRTVSDIFSFLDSWFAGDADFDGNGLTEVADIFAFLSCWFSPSCP